MGIFMTYLYTKFNISRCRLLLLLLLLLLL